MQKSKFLFGDIVVVDDIQIGVIVKSWFNDKTGYSYDVYVRSYNSISLYNENDINRYRVRHKYLEGEELEYQNI